MNEYTYVALKSQALEFYKENGMTVDFNEDDFNGTLTIAAPDEATADKIRMTFTDIRMWERVS